MDFKIVGRVTKVGHSLCIFMTKDFKNAGIKEGDLVSIAVTKLRLDPAERPTDFDPETVYDEKIRGYHIDFSGWDDQQILVYLDRMMAIRGNDALYLLDYIRKMED